MSVYTPSLRELVMELDGALDQLQAVTLELQGDHPHKRDRERLWEAALRYRRAVWSYEAHRRNTTPT